MNHSEIVIPTFTSVTVDTGEKPAEATFAISDAPSLLAGKEPVFELRLLGPDSYALTMRSSLNATLLTASLSAAQAQDRACIESLKLRCHDEDAYRIESTADGYVFCVADEQGQVFARSKPYQNETLARATLRLTAIQSRKARIVLIRD